MSPTRYGYSLQKPREPAAHRNGQSGQSGRPRSGHRPVRARPCTRPGRQSPGRETASLSSTALVQRSPLKSVQGVLRAVLTRNALGLRLDTERLAPPLNRLFVGAPRSRHLAAGAPRVGYISTKLLIPVPSDSEFYAGHIPLIGQGAGFRSHPRVTCSRFRTQGPDSNRAVRFLSTARNDETPATQAGVSSGP